MQGASDESAWRKLMTKMVTTTAIPLIAVCTSCVVTICDEQAKTMGDMA